MALSTETAAALVAAEQARQAPHAPPQWRVRVVRSFVYGGEPLPVGAELDLPRSFAAEMLGANKVARLPPPTPETAAPPAARAAAKAVKEKT